MKLKNIIVASVLAVSQVAMVLPASAEEAVTTSAQTSQTSQSASEPTVNSTEASNQNINGNVEQGGVTSDTQIQQQETTDSVEGTTPAEGNDTVNGNASTPLTEPVTTPVPTDATVNNSNNQLILMMNSNKMYQNGKEYLAGYPMEVKKGVSYISIRAIVERAGFHLTFDNKTKETIIQRGNDELRFKSSSSSYKVNGVTKTMKGSSYVVKNNFMVPLTAITSALNITYSVDQPGKRVVVNLSTTPVASFSVGNKEIIAGETTVQYIPSSYSPTGLEIVNEEWIGRQDVFSTPGNYTVTYRVQDSSGQWSNPYSLTINVAKPHTPPVANFMTGKDTYKMGELVTYSDFSTDEVGIVDWKWDNKQLAFFTPGPTVIRLTVTNKFGLSSTVERTITITNETLYTRDDFYKLYTPVGDKFGFDGTSVPSWEKLDYNFYSEPTTLIRSNSPETVYSEGLVYKETASGNTRFMVHHVNSTGKNVKMYVIATNNNAETARFTQYNMGFGGPSPYATAAGKVSVDRYYESIQKNNNYKDMWIAPGESKIVLSDLSNIAMKKNEVISLFSDAYSDRPLTYYVIMIDSSKDPFTSLPYLSELEEDVHNRGTYADATRNFEYSNLVGETPVRLMIGDNSKDPYLVGTDGVTTDYKLNAGNFGVLYRIKLYRVAPNTLITFNPRGGRYYGSIMVNGNIVQLSTAGSLSAPNEQAVLYRTGEREQTVEMLFTAAPGSNLSVNLLLQPLPQTKANN
ncbi:hypothetical protein D3C76_575380 [compost metagenome]